MNVTKRGRAVVLFDFVVFVPRCDKGRCGTFSDICEISPNRSEIHLRYVTIEGMRFVNLPNVTLVRITNDGGEKFQEDPLGTLTIAVTCARVHSAGEYRCEKKIFLDNDYFEFSVAL